MGIEIGDNPFALETFHAHACPVTDDLVAKIPVDVARQALATVPPSFKWWNRAGDDYIEYGSRKMKYSAPT